MDVKQARDNRGQSSAKLTQEDNAAGVTHAGRRGALISLRSSDAPQRGKRKLDGGVWTFGAADKRVHGPTTLPPPPTAIGSSSSTSQEPAGSSRNGLAVERLPPEKVGSGSSRSGESSASRRGEQNTPAGDYFTDRGHDDDGSGNGDDTVTPPSGNSKRQHTLKDSGDCGTDVAVSLRAPRDSEKSLPAVLLPSFKPIAEGSTSEEFSSPPQIGSCWPSPPSNTTTERLAGNAFGVVDPPSKGVAAPDDAVSQNAAGATAPERSPAPQAARPYVHENDTPFVRTDGDASLLCSGPSAEGMGHERERTKAAIAMSMGTGQEKPLGHRHGGVQEENEKDAAMAGRLRIPLRCLQDRQSKSVTCCVVCGRAS